MKMLPIAVPLVSASPRGRAALSATAAGALPDGLPQPGTPRDAVEPDWQSAYQRRRDEEQPGEPEAPPPLLSLLPVPAPLPQEAMPAVAEVRMAPSTPTTERIEAVRQLADANAATPTAREWQVELPGTHASWQLQVTQAQPQAPLNLALHVPPVAQAQARQQLSDLDKRLRDAGHDVLRPRVRDARGARGSKRALPTDEVTP